MTKKQLKNLFKVEQLENKNQFLLKSENTLIFQSYESIIAYYDKKEQKLTLFSDWDYSNTTRKHLYIFMLNYCSWKFGEIVAYTKNKRQAIEKAIKSKVIRYSSEF